MEAFISDQFPYLKYYENIVLQAEQAWVDGHWLDNLKRKKIKEIAKKKNSNDILKSVLIAFHLLPYYKAVSSYDPFPNLNTETQE